MIRPIRYVIAGYAKWDFSFVWAFLSRTFPSERMVCVVLCVCGISRSFFFCVSIFLTHANVMSKQFVTMGSSIIVIVNKKCTNTQRHTPLLLFKYKCHPPRLYVHTTFVCRNYSTSMPTIYTFTICANIHTYWSPTFTQQTHKHTHKPTHWLNEIKKVE